MKPNNRFNENNINRRSFFAKALSLIAAAGILPKLPLKASENTAAASPMLLAGSEPFLAEIVAVGFNFAPVGWAKCDGQLLPISQNTALFSLLGTYYGGDGKSTFALPNLQDNFAIHSGYGQGQGLSERFLGETGGSEYVTLIQTEMPVHNHSYAKTKCSSAIGTSDNPEGRYFARDASGNAVYGTSNDSSVFLMIGGSQPHNNMPPFLTLNCIIALQGVYPQRH